MSISLTLSDITFVDQPLTKTQAIHQVAQQMSDAGLVTADYAQAMFDRDAQISTFLGNGIAIPHGTTDKRDSVLQTGLKVLYLPHGVQWDEDNTAYVVIGIAAKSNEHLDVLRKLTRVIIDESALTRIKAVTSPAELLVILTGETVAEPAAESAGQGDREFTVTLYNPHGLHTRPASMLVKAIKNFTSEIHVANTDNAATFVNAKSMMKLVSLGVKSMQKMTFVITGDDAAAAEEAIRAAIDAGLGEDLSGVKG